MCVCVCVCMCGCVCLCVCERDRGRERKKEKEKQIYKFKIEKQTNRTEPSRAYGVVHNKPDSHIIHCEIARNLPDGVITIICLAGSSGFVGTVV